MYIIMSNEKKRRVHFVRGGSLITCVFGPSEGYCSAVPHMGVLTPVGGYVYEGGGGTSLETHELLQKVHENLKAFRIPSKYTRYYTKKDWWVLNTNPGNGSFP